MYPASHRVSERRFPGSAISSHMYAKRAQPTVSIEPVSAGRERCRFDNTRSCLEKVVSRPGIEPGTFRLRVLCNQGSGEVTPRLYARHCAGEVRRDRLRRKYWNTPEIGSPAIDPRPARPPLTCWPVGTSPLHCTPCQPAVGSRSTATSSWSELADDELRQDHRPLRASVPERCGGFGWRRRRGLP